MAKQRVRPFSVERQGDVHLITLSPESMLDETDIAHLGDELRCFFLSIRKPRIVINLGSLSHLPSSALAMLLTAWSDVNAREGSLCLASVHADLLEVFRVTKLDRRIRIRPDIDSAVESLG